MADSGTTRRATTSRLPLVSIVTPSLNHARFIRQAIDSVLEQDYPALEYVVIDGGSQDGTLDILESYGSRVSWSSEPDSGQTEALTRGFASTRGHIIGWLNSDDALCPGAVTSAVNALIQNPDAGLVYGMGTVIDEFGRTSAPYPWTQPFDRQQLIRETDFVLQPAAFFRRDVFDAAGGLDHGLQYAFDWDLWIRLTYVADAVFLPEILACTRLWDGTKTSRGGWSRVRELSRVASRHAGSAVTPMVRRELVTLLSSPICRRLPARLHSSMAAFARRVTGTHAPVSAGR